MRLPTPKRVHRKRAKGKYYYYYVSTRKGANGKPIRVRLPDFASNGFWRAYSACVEREETAPETVMTMGAFAEKFMRSPRFMKKAAGTQSSYRTYLAVIVQMLDPMEAHEVERQDVVTLMDSMADRPGAANQTVRTLSALFRWGIDAGYVKTNPVSGIEFFEGGEHEPWPEWLLAAALKAEDANVRLAVHLLYYTAARIGDVVKMKWTDIEDGVLTLKQQKVKNADPLEIPLHRELAAMLATLPRGLHTTIVAKPNGKPYTVGTVRAWLQDFAAARGAEVVPHGLRKNAVNALLEAGCAAAQAAAISGQSLLMVEHYAKRRNKRKLGRSAMTLWERTGAEHEKS